MRRQFAGAMHAGSDGLRHLRPGYGLRLASLGLRLRVRLAGLRRGGISARPVLDILRGGILIVPARSITSLGEHRVVGVWVNTESGLRLAHKLRPGRIIIGPGRDGIAPHAISMLHTSLAPHCTKPALRAPASAGLGGAALRRSYLAHLLAIRASSSARCRFES